MRFSIVCVMLLGVLPVAMADVYKCRSEDGRLTFSNTSCPNSTNMLEVRADEKISAEARAQRERDMEKMRRQAELLESARIAPKADAASPAVSGSSAIERGIPSLAPVPASESVGNDSGMAGDPVVNCMLRVERSSLSEVEKQKLLSRCQGGRPLVVQVKPAINPGGAAVPAMAKKVEPPMVDTRLPTKGGAGQNTQQPNCADGDKNCTRALLRP